MITIKKNEDKTLFFEEVDESIFDGEQTSIHKKVTPIYNNLEKNKLMPKFFDFALEFKSMARIMTEWIDDIVQGKKEFDLEDYRNKTLEASKIFYKLQAFVDEMENEDE